MSVSTILGTSLYCPEIARYSLGRIPLTFGCSSLGPKSYRAHPSTLEVAKKLVLEIGLGADGVRREVLDPSLW